jgi:hypothetical protein
MLSTATDHENGGTIQAEHARVYDAHFPFNRAVSHQPRDGLGFRQRFSFPVRPAYCCQVDRSLAKQSTEYKVPGSNNTK